MRIFLLSFFLLSQFLLADNNLTNKVMSTLSEMLLLEDKQKSQKNILLIEKALKQKKAEEEKAEKEREAEKARNQKALIQEARRLAEEKKLLARINILDEKKKLIDSELSKDNMWASQYAPYETYRSFNMKLQEIADEVKDYKNEKNLSEVEKLELKRLEEEYKIVSGKISQLNEYNSNPFVDLIKPIKLEDEPVITNPLDIITAMSYQKHLKTLKEENDRKYTSLSVAVIKIREKRIILQELALLSDNKKYVEELGNTKSKLKDFELALEVFETSVDTFVQKVSQINLNIDKGIEGEVKRSIVTGIIILILLLIFILVKYLVRKYMSDNDLFYGINKVINFVFIFLSLLFYF